VAPHARATLSASAVPAGLVLLVIALAASAGAGGALFYLFLLGLVISAAGSLSAFGVLVDCAEGCVPSRLDHARALLGAVVVLAFFLGAAARSPVVAELAAGVPGLAGLAVVLGLLAVCGQLVAALPAVRQREDDVRAGRRLAAPHVDEPERPPLRPVGERSAGRVAADDLPDVRVAL
jgi:predicted MFS family arabinose efflux permease